MNTSAINPIVERVVDRMIDPLVDRLQRVTRQTTHKRSVLGTTAVVLGLAVTGGLVIVNLVNRAAQRKSQKSVETRRDRALKETFPASDPPASQYYDIPANRQ